MKYLLRRLILAVILYAVLIYAFLDVMKKKDEIKKLEVDKQEKVVENGSTRLRFEQIVKDSFYEEK